MSDCEMCHGEGTYETPDENACGGPWFRYCDCEAGRKTYAESGEEQRRLARLARSPQAIISRRTGLLREAAEKATAAAHVLFGWPDQQQDLMNLASRIRKELGD